jgi:hypothetical protein
VGAGQIRTNNFSDSSFLWTLREFKLVAKKVLGPVKNPGLSPKPKLRAVEVPVAANPFGTIFDDSVKLGVGDACRDAFIASSVPALLSDDVNVMSVDVPLECLAAESIADGQNFYPSRLAAGSDFATRIQTRITQLDPASTLTPADIAARAAFSGACIGCHNEANGQDLGNGVTGPFSLGFVHTDEFIDNDDCGDGHSDCFLISDAVRNTFLPHREQIMEEFISSGPCCDIIVLDEGFGDAQPIDPIEPVALDDVSPEAIAQAEADADANVSQQTVGGASSHRAH